MKPKYNSIKGRKLQTYLRNKLLKMFPHLKENDIDVAKTGENGHYHSFHAVSLET